MQLDLQRLDSQLVVMFDPTPRPVRFYAELWHRDEKTLNGWCRKGWVPGSFRHPCGEWWVKPLELIGFDADVVEKSEPTTTPKRGSRKFPVNESDRWKRRLKPPSLD